MPRNPAGGGTLLLLFMILFGVGHSLHLEVIERSRKGDDKKAVSTKVIRYKREWIIPPVTITEEQDNSWRNPIAKIQSDYQIDRRITYRIEGMGVTKPPLGIFIINERTGELNVTGIVDREETPMFYLKGYALDQNGNNAEPPIDLRVKVVDINDNDPVFTNEVFFGVIEELSPAHTLVLQLNATDADDPNTINAKLAYKVISQEPGDIQIFEINKDTGEVYSKVSNIDREKQSSYYVVVEVRDNDGKAGSLSGTAALKIKVKDVNDNIPYLEKDQYEGTVEENTANVEVLRMKAIDFDEEFTDNWLANFTIVSGNEQNIFQIITDTATNEGILMVVKEVDYEMMQNVELSVVVSNKAVYHSSIISAAGGAKTVSIKVKVKNVPEGPVFKPNRKTLLISEGKTKVQTVIGSYRAYDGDTGKVAENVKYAKEYDPDNWFTIDPITADIKLIKLPDRESIYVVNGIYVAKILAISEDLPGKTATGTIAIEVGDENDNCPTIINPIQTVCNTADFINVTAVDRDDFPFGAPFNFSIIDEPPGYAKFWTIGPSNGFSVQLKPQNIWDGPQKVHILVKDNQGLSCPEKQILSLFICTCVNGDACNERMVDKSVKLGAAAIGLMILTCLLLLLVPLLLLLCYCGSAGKGFMAIPDGTDATFVKWNNEGAAPENMAGLAPHILAAGVTAGGSAAAAAGGMRKGEAGFQSMDGMYHSSSIMDRRWEEQRRLISEAEFAQAGAAGTTLRSMAMLGSGSGSGGAVMGGAYSSAIIAGGGAALDEGFIREYFSDKAFGYSDEDQAQPAKDCILTYTQEDAGSLSGSVGCCSFIESEFDYDCLDDLGMKFKALADICQGMQTNTVMQVERHKSYEELAETTKSFTMQDVQHSQASVNIGLEQEVEAAPAPAFVSMESSFSSHVQRKEPEMVVREEVITEDSTRYIHNPAPRGNILVTEKSYTTGPAYFLEPRHQQNVLVTERLIGSSPSLHNMIDLKDGQNVHQNVLVTETLIGSSPSLHNMIDLKDGQNVHQNVLVTERLIGSSPSLQNMIDLKDGQNVMVTKRVITSDKARPGLVAASDSVDSQYVVVTERVLAPSSGLQTSLSIPDLAVGKNVVVTERHYTPIQGNVILPTEISGGSTILKEGSVPSDQYANNDQFFKQGGYLSEELPPSTNNISKSTSRVTKHSTVQYTRS
uniref:Desmoglein 2 n=1 Tax=Xenopus tropicalis TaxID=8364 RepID=A0A803JA93_XENTR